MHRVTYISIGATLIIFASVATVQRFGNLPFGTGEIAVILLFLWALRYKHTLNHLRHPIMVFWMGFITIVGVAALLNPLKGAGYVHTAVAYMYTACFSLAALTYTEQASQQQFNSFIRTLILMSVALLAIPLCCFLTDSYRLAELIGTNTEYPRLSAWSTNPNQLALFLLPIPAWMMAVYRDSSWHGTCWLRKFLFIWFFFLIGISVRSDALLLAWSIGLPLLAVMTYFWMKRFNWKIPATMLAAFVLAFFSFKFIVDGPGHEKLLEIETYIANASSSILGTPPLKTVPAIRKSDSMIGVGLDPNKAGVRKTLWLHAYEAWLQFPIIGGGPGAFSYLDDPATKEEAHNLGIDILTQAGIAGVLLFAFMYLWLIVKAYQARDPYSLVILIILMIFSGAHFMLRQPVFSFYMIICALAVKSGSFTYAREKPQPI